MKDDPVCVEHSSIPVLLEIYRNHKITASVEGGVYVGKVFNKGKQVAYCEAVGRAQTEQHLRSIVDTDIEKKYQYRGGNPVSFEELKAALTEIKAYLEADYISMLRRHYKAPEGTISLATLAQLGHCASTTEVYFIYASIARCLCDELAYMPPTQNNGRDPMLSMLIQEADYGATGQNGMELSLEPDIKRALMDVRW